VAFYFSCIFGLPRGRSEDSRPRIAAVFLPASITQWSAASKAVSQGLEFGFCFHSVDMASPLSGLQDRAVPKKSIRPTSSCRLQGRPLPVLTPLDHVRSQRNPLHLTQHRQIVFIGLHSKRFRIAPARHGRCHYRADTPKRFNC
jgi:hypothetical protein